MIILPEHRIVTCDVCVVDGSFKRVRSLIFITIVKLQLPLTIHHDVSNLTEAFVDGDGRSRSDGENTVGDGDAGGGSARCGGGGDGDAGSGGSARSGGVVLEADGPLQPSSLTASQNSAASSLTDR